MGRLLFYWGCFIVLLLGVSISRGEAKTSLSFTSQLDMQTWYGAWNRPISRLYNQYDISLTHIVQQAKHKRDHTIYWSMQAQAGSDLALNQTNYTYSNGAPLVELWIAQAAFTFLVPRLQIQAQVGRHTTFATHRVVPIDGISWQWSSTSKRATQFKIHSFVGKVPVMGYHSSGGSRWGMGWTQSMYLNEDKDQYRWPIQRSDVLANQSILADTSLAETRAVWSMAGWRVGGTLELIQYINRIRWTLKLRSDQRRFDSQVLEERLGYVTEIDWNQWHWDHGVSYDSLLQEWGSIWTQLHMQWSKQTRFTFKVRWQKPLWPLDSIWWVFAQRPEQRVSLSMDHARQSYHIVLNPYWVKFDPLSSDQADEQINRQTISIGEEGLGMNLTLQWPSLPHTILNHFSQNSSPAQASSWRWSHTIEVGGMRHISTYKTYSTQLVWSKAWQSWGCEQYIGMQYQAATRIINHIYTSQRQDLSSYVLWYPNSVEDQYLPWLRSVFFVYLNPLIKLKADLSVSYHNYYWSNAMFILESNPW